MLPANAYVWLLVHFVVVYVPVTLFFVRVAFLNKRVKVTGDGFKALASCWFSATTSMFIYVGILAQQGWFEAASGALLWRFRDNTEAGG